MAFARFIEKGIRHQLKLAGTIRTEYQQKKKHLSRSTNLDTTGNNIFCEIVSIFNEMLQRYPLGIILDPKEREEEEHRLGANRRHAVALLNLTWDYSNVPVVNTPDGLDLGHRVNHDFLELQQCPVLIGANS